MSTQSQVQCRLGYAISPPDMTGEGSDDLESKSGLEIDNIISPLTQR